jgi:hypothetical protein
MRADANRAGIPLVLREIVGGAVDGLSLAEPPQILNQERRIDGVRVMESG